MAMKAIVIVLAGASLLGAAEERERTARGASSREVVAGARYQAGAIHRFIWGSGYRDLWATPIQVEVLDLDRFSGGLEPEKKGGGKQTVSLHFEGADGREWKFRSVDKDPTAVLPKSVRGHVGKWAAQDQIGSSHPAGALVVDGVLDATGIPHLQHRLFVMPDHPRLGRYREEFSGMFGMLEEKPRVEPPVTPGFSRFERVIESEELHKLIDSDARERVDARAFLKARLVDMLVGDYDRHDEQWYWGKDKTSGRWIAVPKDRDLSFVQFDGLAMTLFRPSEPRFVDFEAEYPRAVGLGWQSRFLDRRYLAELSWQEWPDVVAELQARITDDVIEKAVRRMPGPYYQQVGAEMTTKLVARRERLLEAAQSFYTLLAKEPEVHATDQNDLLQISRHADRSVDVALSGAGGTYFKRRFHPSETEEVRVYLKGGNDRAFSEGQPNETLVVRVVGGDGDDLLDDSASGRTRFYDSGEDSRVNPGAGTLFDTRHYEVTYDENGDALRDWGKRVAPLPWAKVGAGRGIVLGAQVQKTRYGFRKHPFASRHTLRLGYSTRLESPRAEYQFISYRIDSKQRLHVEAEAAELDVIRFHGFGNETRQAEPELFNEVRQRQLALAPSYRFELDELDIGVGPILKYAQTPARTSLVEIVRPYGYPDYGQLGARLSIVRDRRDHVRAATAGSLLGVRGTFYPSLWSVEDPFGEVQGEAAAYVTPGLLRSATFALRAVGQKIFGRYPFHEAAYIGGPNSIRALRRQRYGGDASLYGNAELRLPLFGEEDGARFGVFGFTDAGRVFLEGESSQRWHYGGGAGLFFTPSRADSTVTGYVARSEGRTKLRLQMGFMF
jgi:hypothetical protein